MGVVTHYYTRISVALVELKDTLSIGNRTLIQGGMYLFTTNSMQIEHKNVIGAGSGQNIGLKVDKRVRKGDKVYRVT